MGDILMQEHLAHPQIAELGGQQYVLTVHEFSADIKLRIIPLR